MTQLKPIDFYVANLLTSIDSVQPDLKCMCSHTTGLTGGTGFCGDIKKDVGASKAKLRAMVENMATVAPTDPLYVAVENAHKAAEAFLKAQLAKT